LGGMEKRGVMEGKGRGGTARIGAYILVGRIE
jgi:hypothetical protein